MGTDEAKESFNQSNQKGRSRYGNTYEARPFGGGFHTKRLNIGRRSFLWDEVGQLRRFGRAGHLSTDGVPILFPALVEFGAGEMLMLLFVDHATRLKHRDQIEARIHDRRTKVNCACGEMGKSLPLLVVTVA